MAKRGRNPAKGLGEAFGSVGNRYRALQAERDEVAAALRSVLEDARSMLAGLQEDAAPKRRRTSQRSVGPRRRKRRKGATRR